MSLINQGIVKSQVLHVAINYRFVQDGTGFAGDVPMGTRPLSGPFAGFDGTNINITKSGNYFVNVDFVVQAFINRGNGLNFFRLRAGNTFLAQIQVLGQFGEIEYFNNLINQGVWVYDTGASAGTYSPPDTNFQFFRGQYSNTFMLKLAAGDKIGFELGSDSSAGKAVGFGGFISIGEIT